MTGMIINNISYLLFFYMFLIIDNQSEKIKEAGVILFHMYNFFMTALSLTLAYLALHIPLWKYQESIETLQSEVQTLAVEAEPALQLIESVSQRHQVLDNLTDYKRRVYPMADVLLELTNLAPDNTWLKSLERTDNKLILRGESKQTSTFIERLERSPMFYNVDNSSPPVAIPGTLYERFHLSITLVSKDDK